MKFIELQNLRRLLIPLMLFSSFTVVRQDPVQAQEHGPLQTPDLQQMQKKLEQLESELRELKQQMSAAAESTKTAVPGPSVPVTPETRAAAQEGEQSEPSSTIDFYGFVMLDSGYDFVSNAPNWFYVIRPTKLPAFQGEFGPDGKTYWGVRQTRFGVKTFTPTALGNLRTNFQFDLFGSGANAGETTFHLQQAYGELGPFVVGQTWSPVMDIDVFPNSLEYWGPNGMVFFNNVQVRWMPLQGDNSLTLALERPVASAYKGTYSGHIELQNVVPPFKCRASSQMARSVRQCSILQKVVLQANWRYPEEDRLGRYKTCSLQHEWY